MGKISQNKIRLLISSTIGIFLLFVMLWFVGINELLSAISRANPIWLIFFALTIPVMYLIRAFRWNFLLSSLKNNVKVQNTFWTTSVGFMVNALIPLRIGEFVRAYLLSRKEGLSFWGSFSSIIIERTLDLLSLLAIGLLMIILIPFGTSIPSLLYNIFIIVAILIAIILTIIAVSIKREETMIRFIDRLLSSIFFLSKRKENILKAIKALIDGTKALSQSPKIFAITIVFSIVIWLIQIVGIYFVFIAFGFMPSIPIIFLGGVILFFTFILPAAPGYVGTLEAYFVLIFAGFGLTGVDTLLAIGVVNHLISVVTMLVMGSIGAAWLGYSFEEVLKIRRE
jgi:uncharacterized protein (TIRG00374 family)